MRSKIGSCLFLLFILLAPACANPSPQEHTPSPLAASDTSVPVDTAALIPSKTAIPTSTDTPEPTATQVPTATNTPTQFLGFEDAWIYKAFANDNETVFYFIVPNVSAPYHGSVDGYPLSCKIDAGYQNMLICRSDENLFGMDIRTFEFFADEAKQFLVYSGDYATGLAYNEPQPTKLALIWPKAEFTEADITWAGAETWCPLRGQKITCETEYRNYDGVCLVGHTCFDDCGYYYSVDTIKDRTGDWIGWGTCFP
jgi:hypothetical protein